MNVTEQWLGGAALIGIVAAFWNKAKLLSWRLVNLLVVRARLEGDVGTAVAYYCWNEWKRSPFGEKRYNAITEYIQPVERHQAIGFELIGTDPTLFWLGWRPVLLSFQANEEAKTLGYSVTLTFIRGMFGLDRLVIQLLIS